MANTSSPRTDIARALRVARARLGIEQAEMAERTGCSASMVSLLERGMRAPSAELLAAYAATAGVPLSEMLRWGEEASAP